MQNPRLSQNNWGLPRFTESDTPHQHVRWNQEFGYKKINMHHMHVLTHAHSIRHIQVWCKNINHTVSSTGASYCGFFVIPVLQKISFTHTNNTSSERPKQGMRTFSMPCKRKTPLKSVASQWAGRRMRCKTTKDDSWGNDESWRQLGGGCVLGLIYRRS